MCAELWLHPDASPWSGGEHQWDSSGIPAAEISISLTQQTNTEQIPQTSSWYLYPSHYVWQKWQQ